MAVPSSSVPPKHNEFAFKADSGAACVFAAATGQQLHDLTSTDLRSGYRFGTSVSPSGDLAAIGAERFEGAVHAFDVARGFASSPRKMERTATVSGGAVSTSARASSPASPTPSASSSRAPSPPISPWAGGRAASAAA
ncbi:MAG: hypothetical protein ACPGPE_05515 [Planctomycetota bacterium]